MEPLVATTSFFLFIHLYWWAERQEGVSRINNIRDAAKQPMGYSFQSMFAYLFGIYVWKMFVPPVALQIPDGVPSTLSELLYLTVEIVSGIVAYDFIFFFIHWSMHAIPFLRRFHYHHHAMPESVGVFEAERRVEARDVIHHSLLDGSLQVLVNIFVQRNTPWGLPKSRLARIVHNILVTWMLTESHSSTTYLTIWKSWLVGVREHRLHHINDSCSRDLWISSSSKLSSHVKFDRHQQFFGYLDDLRFLFREWRTSYEVGTVHKKTR